MKSGVRLGTALLMMSVAVIAHAQGISSSILGTVYDAARAVVPNVEVVLTNEITGATLTAASNEVGLFRFPNLLPGRYSIAVKRQGFKSYQQTGIELSTSETRDLGAIVLEVGAIVERVTVTAAVTPVQVASSEKSLLVTGTQLNTIALKGRDFLGLMSLVPGVIDTAASRDTTGGSALNNIFIHGARANQKNYTIDGVTAADIGWSVYMHTEPNMETIAEVRVLTSNYQAEFGRNSGGAISVITKSGQREFHGSGYWNVRNEVLNANDFFRNRSGVPKPPYRYNVAGLSVGGPIYIPKKFNTDRNKLFFFFSQEYTRRRVDFGPLYRNMPTALERTGDFSRSFDTSGRLIPVKDPLTGSAFPGNVIPPSRVNAFGRSMLGFFPLPNYADPDPRFVYQRNYVASASGPQPKRNDMARIDASLPGGLSVFWRMVQDADTSDNLFSGFQFNLTPRRVSYPSNTHAVHGSKSFSPTLVNEFLFGRSHNNLYFDYVDQAKLLRSVMGNVPKWFPIDTSKGDQIDYVPNVSFGATPVNAPSVALAEVPYNNWSTVYNITDNITKVYGAHNFKAGIYIERSDKKQQQPSMYRGAFSFAPNPNNPNDSGHGFANALLGNFNSYLEATDRVRVDYRFWTAEWYAQDNWRIARRLTLDLGLRFYHLTPYVDENKNQGGFDQSSFNPAQAPRLYLPGRDASGRRVAVDPLTKATAADVLIGRYVPGSGDPANGMKIGGRDGYSAAGYKISPLGLAPRVGFAYDVFGNGRTAVRGGFGMFYNRTDAFVNLANMAGVPPITYTPVLWYSSLNTFAQAAGFIGPTDIAFYSGKNQLETTMNFSLGVQQDLGFSTVLEASYVGSLGRHLMWGRSINAIPKYSRFDPANADPTNPSVALPDDFFRPYQGWSNLTRYEFGATSNYHATELAVQRRFRKNLMFGVAYTWSKVLGVTSGDRQGTSPYFAPRARDYGPLSFDRRHNFVVNYLYEFPNIARRLGQSWLAAVTDYWFVSGITMFQSGGPFTPGFSTTYAVDFTGSSEAARINLIADPKLPKSERSFYRNFRTEAFAPPAARDFGNAGVGILTGPGINNWDLTVGKKIPIGLGEQRMLQFRGQFFNAWNHTQFSGGDATARFDAAGRQISQTFGAFTSVRPARVISLTLRFEF